MFPVTPRQVNSMREATTHCLWLGNALEARDVSTALRQGIVAIVDLAIQFPRDIVYCRIPLVDGSGNRLTSCTPSRNGS